MRCATSRGLVLTVGLLHAPVAHAGLIAAMLEPPPTAEQCLCGGQSGWIGAPDAEGCVREFKFPPVGGYTDDCEDELNLPPGITTWRPFVSTCWRTYIPGTSSAFAGTGTDPDPGWSCPDGCVPNWELRGFAPSLDLRFGAVQGDYLPMTVEPAASTSPLASASGLRGSPRSPHTRGVLGSAVDLITGQPLVQEIDFELPFGNTVFRHMRTYSQYPQFRIENHDARDGNPDYRLNESGMFWDATGFGWMIGHSPLLLIDAAYAGWDTGAPFELTTQQQIERCMFLPDAHRAIPFMSLQNGRYEAPPRFDAALSHNAELPADFDQPEPNPDPGEFVDKHRWIKKPTEWTVWLQNRSMKYTMMPVYDDIRWHNGSGASLNDYPPPSSTDVCAHDSYLFGRPHYAVATKIEDEWGNRIEIDYCSFKQRPVHNGLNQATGCSTCQQDCSAKGMIEQVRLIAGRAGVGENTADRVAYRLVYVYRPGPLISLRDGLQNYSDFAQPMVHEVYVVPGDVEVPAGCRMIPDDRVNAVHASYDFENALECLTSLHALTWDAALESEFSGSTQWLDKWIIRVRYLYADNNAMFEEVSQNHYEIAGLFHGCALRLIQTSVTHREHPESFDEEPVPLETSDRTEHTVYRYRWNFDGVMRETGELRAIYRHATLERLREALVDQGALPPESHTTWPLQVHLMLDEDVPEPQLPESPDLLGWADQSFDAWHEARVGALRYGDGAGDQPGTIDNLGERPAEFFRSAFHKEMVDDYLRGVPNDPTASSPQKRMPVLLTDGVATHVDRAGTQRRAYRLYRFLMMSTDPSARTVPPCPGATHPDTLCGSADDTDAVEAGRVFTLDSSIPGSKRTGRMDQSP